jgi:predicted enzyme related to lactoylglutathione lyase
MSRQDNDRRIDYVEFQTTDVERSKAFYSSVFGWSFTDFGPDYTSFEDGRLTGGFSKAESVEPGGPLIVIYAVDLGATEVAVREHGGSIVKGIFSFPGGERFHFADPTGNILAVWSDQ